MLPAVAHLEACNYYGDSEIRKYLGLQADSLLIYIIPDHWSG